MEDVESLLSTLCANSSGRGCRTIRDGETVREVLENTASFLEKPPRWQVNFLQGVGSALRSRTDVVRFLCLGVQGEDRTTIAAVQHRWAFESLLRIYDGVCEGDSAEAFEVADATLFLLATIVSAGTEPLCLQALFRRASQAFLARDSKSQLRFLRVVDFTLRKAIRDSSWGESFFIDPAVAAALHPFSPSPSTFDLPPHEPPGTIRCSPEPAAFLNFAGSGLSISGVGEWPFAKEYCLWLWIRMEEDCGKTTLLKLLTNKGHGIEISLVGDDLIGYSIMMHSSDERGKTNIRIAIPTDVLQARVWHQITIHHFSRFLGSSQLKVCIDGHELKQQSGYSVSLAFPSRMSHKALSQATLLEGFDGQLGACYIFLEGISTEISTSLVRAHMERQASFEIREGAPGTGLLVNLIDRNLEPQVFLCYDPTCCVRDLCLDLYGGHHGKYLGPACSWKLANVKRIQASLGGVSTLLPFLWKRSSIVPAKMEANSPRSPVEQPSSALADGACVVQIINLLALSLLGNLAAQREFRQLGGAALIAAALERLPQTVLSGACDPRLELRIGRKEIAVSSPTSAASVNSSSSSSSSKTGRPGPPLFVALQNLYIAVLSWPEVVFESSSPRGETPTAIGGRKYNALESEIESRILFNPVLVARCSGERIHGDSEFGLSTTQQVWLESLETRVKKDPNLYRAVLGLQCWIDGTRRLYENLDLLLDLDFEQEREREQVDGFPAAPLGLEHFLERLSYHFVRIAASFVADSISKEDLWTLLTSAAAGGLGASRFPQCREQHNPAEQDKIMSLQSFGNSVLSLFSAAASESDLTRPQSPASDQTKPHRDKHALDPADVLLMRDGIRVLTILFRLDPSPKGLFEECARIDTSTDVAGLLTGKVVARKDVGDEVRALALRCIHDYLRKADRSSSGLISLSPLSQTHRAVEHFALVGGYQSVLQSFQSVAANKDHSRAEGRSLERVCSVLLEVMLMDPQQPSASKQTPSRGSLSGGEASGEFLRAPYVGHGKQCVSLEDLFNGQATRDLVFDDTQTIRNPFALAVLVHLLPAMSLFLQQKICQDLFLLLKFQEANRKTLIGMPGWEGAFLGVLGALEDCGVRSSGGQVCYDLAMKLFLLPLQDCFLETKDGWVHLENILVLHPVLATGKDISYAILVQLFQEAYRFLQSEGVPENFVVFWNNLKRLCYLVELHCARGEGASSPNRLAVVDALLRIVDLVGTFPPHLLKESDDQRLQNQHDESKDFPSLMLRRFCWPTDPRAQSEFEKIRGPLAFVIITLSIAKLETRALNTPLFAQHVKRLVILVSALRKMPKVKSLVRWTTWNGKKVKGEKSALVLRLLLKALCLLKDAREEDLLGNANVVLSVEHLLELVRMICQVYEDLLEETLPNNSLLKPLQEGPNERSVAEWILSLENLDELVDEIEHGESREPKARAVKSDNFCGAPGAFRALEESETGYQAFVESRSKKLFEQYWSREMDMVSSSKKRATLEQQATAFYRRLAYSELQRLSVHLAEAEEIDLELIATWQRLMLESSHSGTFWGNLGRDMYWMISDKEDTLRCRRVLVPNFRFDDHEEAIYRTAKHESDDNDMKALHVIPVRPLSANAHAVRVHSPVGGRDQEMEDVTALEEITTFLRKHETEDALHYFMWLGGRLAGEADLTWFVWLGGRVNPSHKLRSLVATHESSPHSSETTEPTLVRQRIGSMKMIGAGSLAKPLSKEPEKEQEDQVVVDEGEEEGDDDEEERRYHHQEQEQEQEQEQQQALESGKSQGNGELEEVSWSSSKAQRNMHNLKNAKSSLLTEMEEWAVGDSQRTQNEQFVLRKDEILVHVCSSALWVTPLQVCGGRLEVSTAHIFFYAAKKEATGGPRGEGESLPEHSTSQKRQKMIMMRWSLADLAEVYGRRYLLRDTALELFFKDRTNTFLCFPSTKARTDCFSAILRQQTPNLSRSFKETLHPKAIFEKLNIQEKWRRREISNFEYLMLLNTIAGRSYNDITQYPVFPWVLCDYVSEELDLNDPRVYRDLSKPIGALNDDRLQEFLERFENFSDPTLDIPPFHYGSHYSNAGIVLHYLLRMEPYTTLAIELQGGRFDCPERLFFSIEDCWLSSMESMSDVKELIPEFFYCPEMFLNLNKFDLGAREGTEEQIGDVLLPPWAKGSASEFVRLNREALESEYVSEHLHLWIDLVFGFKQKGRNAVDAHNVFYYLTYEGAVDLDAIVDPVQRHSIESQIAYFGQTPSQLLTKPHPERQPLNPRKRLAERLGMPNGAQSMEIKVIEVWSEPVNGTGQGLTGSAGSSGPLAGFTSLLKGVRFGSSTAGTGSSGGNSKSLPPLVFLACLHDRVVAVHEDLGVGVHRLSANSSVAKVNTLRILNAAPLSISVKAHPRDVALVGSEVGDSMRIGGESILCAKQGKLIVTGNYLDGSLRAQNLDNPRMESAVVAHQGRVLCIALCEKEEYIVTGSEDCTVGVWQISGANDIKEEMMDLFGAPDLASSSNGSGPSRTSSGTLPKQDRLAMPAGYQTVGNGLLAFLRRFVGHTQAISGVAISNGMSLVVSGARNGQVLIHSLDQGVFLRRLCQPNDDGPVTLVRIAHLTGNIAVFFSSRRKLAVFTVNGTLLSSVELSARLHSVCFAYVGGFGREILLGGDSNGSIHIWSSHDLGTESLVDASKGKGAIRAIQLAQSGEALFFGTEAGAMGTMQLSSMSATMDL